MNKQKLLSILTNFFNSIEKNKDFEFSDLWNILEYKNFPNWKCDCTSELLKKFLNEEYNLEFKYRRTEYNCWSFHIYLINNDYLIDITASQFNFNKSFPEFDWVEFPKIIILEWNDKENYFFEQKFNPQTKDYQELFISSNSYIDFYNKLVHDYYNFKGKQRFMS